MKACKKKRNNIIRVYTFPTPWSQSGFVSIYQRCSGKNRSQSLVLLPTYSFITVLFRFQVFINLEKFPYQMRHGGKEIGKKVNHNWENPQHTLSSVINMTFTTQDTVRKENQRLPNTQTSCRGFFYFFPKNVPSFGDSKMTWATWLGVWTER